MTEISPTPEDAAAVAQRALGMPVRTVTRFPTGLAHYVFEVTMADGRRVVARLGQPDQAADFASARSWHERLAPRGVPLPELLAVETDPLVDSYPFMLMERLPGHDLHEVYSTLSDSQKRQLARRIAAIQTSVGELPLGPGFGYARSYEDPTLHATWTDVLLASLDRSRTRMQSAGLASPNHVDRVADKLAPYRSYLEAIPPPAFLDDITTKNVLVHEGRLSGIVDVDVVCFGDPLFTVALTRMSLLARSYDTTYIDDWMEAMGSSDEQLAVLNLYTAIFCVDFLGELGHRFNREAAPTVAEHEITYLVALLDQLLAEL